MRTVSLSVISRLAFCTVPHSSVVADVQSSGQAVVKNSIDDDVTDKVAGARLFDPQTYRRERVWLTLFQMGKF